MDFFQAVVLGIIQGMAEWLPISSEAMVTLAGKFLFDFEYTQALENAIWLHTGTFLSAVIYFRNDIRKMVLMKNKGRNLLKFLAVSTLLTGIIAVPLLFLAFSISLPDWLFTVLIGIFLILVAALQKVRSSETDNSLELKKAAFAGLAQSLAIFPGISRSGFTTAALLSQKFSLREAFRLSFLMSIPVTFGVQMFLPLVREGFTVTAPMLAGAFTSMAVGLLTISALMEFARKVDFFKATFSLGLVVLALGVLLM